MSATKKMWGERILAIPKIALAPFKGVIMLFEWVFCTAPIPVFVIGLVSSIMLFSLGVKSSAEYLVERASAEKDDIIALAPCERQLAEAHLNERIVVTKGMIKKYAKVCGKEDTVNFQLSVLKGESK